MTDHSLHFLSTDTFWALIALILFLLILIYLKVPRWVACNLDDRAKRIAQQLEEAKRMRLEAEALLIEYQRKFALAKAEAQNLLEAAERRAEALSQEAMFETQQYIESRNKAAEEKIREAERTAVSAVKSAAIDLSIEVANKIITERLDTETAAQLFESSLTKLTSPLN